MKNLFFLGVCILTLSSNSSRADSLYRMGEQCQKLFSDSLMPHDASAPLFFRWVIDNISNGTRLHHQITDVYVAPKKPADLNLKVNFHGETIGRAQATDFKTDEWVAHQRKSFYDSLMREYDPKIPEELLRYLTWIDDHLDRNGESIGDVSTADGITRASMRLYEGMLTEGQTARRRYPFEYMFELRGMSAKVKKVTDWLDQIYKENQTKEFWKRTSVREMGRYFTSGDREVRHRAQRVEDMWLLNTYALEHDSIFIGHIASDFNLQYFENRYKFTILDTIEVAPKKYEYIVVVTGANMAGRLKEILALPDDPLLDYFINEQLKSQRDQTQFLCSLCT